MHGVDTSLYFTPGGVTFALNDAAKGSDEQWAVKLDFVGANAVEPTGVDLAQGVVSHVGGGAGKAQTAIPTYSSIAYEDLWPGIDMVYAGTGSKLKYSFVVHPGADPSQIRLTYRGASSVALNDKGQLNVNTPAGGFTDDTPYSYQDVGGRHVEVPSSYQLGHSGEGAATVTIPVGDYDATRELVIDPVVLVRAGYIGGTGHDSASDLALDGAGNAYITGGTVSADFPVTVGPSLTYNGNGDAYVAKVNPAGTALEYAGYIGGALQDFGSGLAVDADGNAYVGGAAYSNEDSFPVVGGPDVTLNGNSDAFVAKVNPTGTGLVYAGYLGGAGFDNANGVAVDGAGNAYLSGSTDSPVGFPVTVGPDLTFNVKTKGHDVGRAHDAFVAKIDASGNNLLYAGYIGGHGFEAAYDITVDSAGAAYVVGQTASNQQSFPISRTTPDRTFGGGIFSDGFIAKVNPGGTGLVYAGYIGGDTLDGAYGVAVDGVGAAYVAGWTGTTTRFPMPGGFDTTQDGPSDGYVMKVNPSGSAFEWGTFLGGAAGDGATGIGVDGAGDVHVAGGTSSSEATFPVVGGPDLTYNGGSSDAFVAKISQAG